MQWSTWWSAAPRSQTPPPNAIGVMGMISEKQGKFAFEECKDCTDTKGKKKECQRVKIVEFSEAHYEIRYLKDVSNPAGKNYTYRVGWTLANHEHKHFAIAKDKWDYDDDQMSVWGMCFEKDNFCQAWITLYIQQQFLISYKRRDIEDCRLEQRDYSGCTQARLVQLQDDLRDLQTESDRIYSKTTICVPCCCDKTRLGTKAQYETN